MTQTMPDSQERIRVGRRAGIVGLAVNLLLFGVKLAAGLISGSISIVTDAINNLTDAGSSVLVLFGYTVSGRPADKEHPYGHARMEYLCSLFVSMIVAFLGFEMFRTSVSSIIDGGGDHTYSALTITIMALCIVSKILLAVYYRTTGKKISSDALRSSAADCIGDVCATGAVLLGIFLTPLIGPRADGIFGAVIAVYIIVMGVKLILDSSNTLLGRAPDIELVKTIVEKLKSYEGVIGVHDLLVHSYGVNRYFASVHVEVDSSCDIMTSHNLIDRIEGDFRSGLGIELIVHMDPVVLNDQRTDSLHLAVREIIDRIASEYSSPISLHDFRVDTTDEKTKLSFDLALTNDFPLSNEELVSSIRKDVASVIGPDVFPVITIDREYTTVQY